MTRKILWLVVGTLCVLLLAAGVYIYLHWWMVPEFVEKLRVEVTPLGGIPVPDEDSTEQEACKDAQKAYHIICGRSYAVVQARVLRVDQMVPPAGSGWWEEPYVSVLIWVERQLHRQIPELGPTRLLRVNVLSETVSLQPGQRVVLPLGKKDAPHLGPHYISTWQMRYYWRILPDGSLEASEALQVFTPYLAQAGLPTTAQAMRRFAPAQIYQPDRVIQMESKYALSYSFRPVVTSGRRIAQTVQNSHLVARVRVVEEAEEQEPNSIAVSERVWVSARLEDVLWYDAYMEEKIGLLPKAGETARWPLLVKANSHMQLGEEYLILVRNNGHDWNMYLNIYELEPHVLEMSTLLYPTARENSIIPMSDTRKVRRVYRALGLEMPQE